MSLILARREHIIRGRSIRQPPILREGSVLWQPNDWMNIYIYYRSRHKHGHQDTLEWTVALGYGATRAVTKQEASNNKQREMTLKDYV